MGCSWFCGGCAAVRCGRAIPGMAPRSSRADRACPVSELPQALRRACRKIARNSFCNHFPGRRVDNRLAIPTAPTPPGRRVFPRGGRRAVGPLAGPRRGPAGGGGEGVLLVGEAADRGRRSPAIGDSSSTATRVWPSAWVVEAAAEETPVMLVAISVDPPAASCTDRGDHSAKAAVPVGARSRRDSRNARHAAGTCPGQLPRESAVPVSGAADLSTRSISGHWSEKRDGPGAQVRTRPGRAGEEAPRPAGGGVEGRAQ